MGEALCAVFPTGVRLVLNYMLSVLYTFVMCFEISLHAVLEPSNMIIIANSASE